jgi:phosphoglycolate phosphatase-like HAD superfamily hydrolase
MVTVAFDIDGTLRNAAVDQNQAPVANEDVRSLLIFLSRFQNVLIHIWSGSGELYARQVAAEFGLNSYVDSFSSKVEDAAGLGIKFQGGDGFVPDIAIDDLPGTELGVINLIVAAAS